ncbi:uncharacterized protein AB675_5270 [Cyphellophora attinorum]|uniref:peptidylprolyl isomerase n=1 Tax=Cyphellophora attinorum TaxID=1664694 RepID=A0A0N0NLP6_9EURO|nr:uncharacterized protein AB675_5270 [Phialophora attinorum]KPI39279.1 hypothetical protein AB675_5270 [Phialophora attinorum]
MSATINAGLYALEIPPDGMLVPAVPQGIPAGIRITMAAIDPTAPAADNATDIPTVQQMATLKLVRVLYDGDDDSEDSDFEDISDEDSDEEMEDVNGAGPSDPKKAKLSKKQALLALAAEDAEDSDDDDSDDSGDEAEAKAVLAKLQKSLKGKGKATEGEDEDSDEDSDEGIAESEHVICTLVGPTAIPQQPLDLTIGEGENVYFRVVGTHTVSLTGTYIIDADPEIDSDEEDEELDSDEELDLMDGLEDLAGDSEADSELDALDDLADPRITEVVEEEIKVEPTKKIKAEKGKNKRPAEESADEDSTLDAIMAKSIKPETTTEAEPTTNGETKKLSKAEKKKLKKLKNNDGAAADAPVAAVNASAEAKPTTNGDTKKVQFAKNLEQGPTPSAAAAKPAETKPAANTTTTPSVRTVQGITIDDRKVGTGPLAKKGSHLSMRYIGKLESNGKVFDSNKTGKPFSFTLGKGEVIKGWDLGLEGMQNGGERRITVPAAMGYGKKGAPPDIPPNSVLRSTSSASV